MKLDAGGKPWRRKPSAPPAVSAARTPAPGRSSESAITASVAAEITQTPGGQPVDAVDQVDHVDHGDDPDDRQHVAEVDAADQPDVEQLDLAQVDPAEERQREGARVDAVEHRDRRGDGLPGELQQRVELEDVVEHARRRRSPPPRPAAPGSAPPRAGRGSWRPRSRRRSPARRASGVGSVCRLRSFGIVDRADPPRDPLGHRDQQPGDHRRDQEREQREDGLGAPVDEHQSRLSPRTASTRSSGSRGWRGPGLRGRAWRARAQSGSESGRSRPSRDQPLVDRAHAAAEDRVDGGARAPPPRGSSSRRR